MIQKVEKGFVIQNSPRELKRAQKSLYKFKIVLKERAIFRYYHMKNSLAAIEKCSEERSEREVFYVLSARVFPMVQWGSTRLTEAELGHPLAGPCASTSPGNRTQPIPQGS